MGMVGNGNWNDFMGMEENGNSKSHSAHLYHDPSIYAAVIFTR